MGVSERTIVIVGGVAGGASAAARARRMNEQAQIIMLERGEHVSFANCGLPYYIGGKISDRNDLLVATSSTFRNRFNVDVRTGHEVRYVDPEAHSLTVRRLGLDESYELNYDRLILSPGASPIHPPVDGVQSDNVFTLRNLADTDRVKRYLDREDVNRVSVIGAGFIGLEMVEMFRSRNLRVDLIELMDQVLPSLDPEMAKLIENELIENNVRLHLGNGLKGLDTKGGKVHGVKLSDGNTLESDLVMLCVGVDPNTELAEKAGLDIGNSGGIRVNTFMQTSDPHIYAVGDAVEYEHQVSNLFSRVPLAGPANRAGRIAGEHAATDSAPHMQPVQGTAIVKIFDRAAALTGLTEKQAEDLNEPHESVWVPGKHHVDYYPGSKRLTIKLNYSPRTGRVLGGEVVGREGVDKRIDVIATAIHFDATVEDVAGLDLAYAPPFGSAKDPVHMAGFAAHNQLRGTANFNKKSDPNAQLLDVRTPQEFMEGHADQAVNIPLSELRDRLDELNSDRSVNILCGIGKRAYYAERILEQKGFDDVKVIGGGYFLHPEHQA